MASAGGARQHGAGAGEGSGGARVATGDQCQGR